MKKFLKAILVAAALVVAAGPRWGFAATRVDATQLFNNTALAFSCVSGSLNTDPIDNLSLMAVWSPGASTAVTFYDGRYSTATVTVSSFTALSATQARTSITIGSTGSQTNSAVAGSYLTLNGVVFKEGYGGKWTYNASFATATARALATAINSDASGLFGASSSSNVVVATVSIAGFFGNSFTCLSSTPNAMTCLGATFTGGWDNARLALNGVTLTQGTDWTAAATSSMTALAIAAAINARPALASIMTATAPTGGSVIFTTATAIGVNAYTMFTSTANALRLNGSSTSVTDTFLNGLASSVDLSTETIFVTNHGLKTAVAVLITTSAGTVPTGLTAKTTYYAIYVDANNFALATTTSNAVAGTRVGLTAVTSTGTFVLTPIAFAGTPRFKIQVSNDDTNWFDLNVASVTYSAASNTFWDLGTPSYRGLRINFDVNGSTGGLNLAVTANGRKSN